MYDFLEGNIVEINPTYAVLAVGGVGYYINISLHTFSQIKDSKSYKLYTSFQVRDDGHYLYGFSDKLERELFVQLISVSGIGPSTGRIMLSSLNPEEISEAIITGDVNTLKRIKGIGPKSAQRIILELQDKLKKQSQDSSSVLIKKRFDSVSSEEAISALIMLGFQKNSVEKVIQALVKENPDATVENLIKTALNKL